MLYENCNRMSLEISVTELKRRLDAGERLSLLDVREPEEFAYAHIAGSKPIPMGTVPAALQEIEAIGDEAPIVCICHHGVRSLRVANWLREQGVDAVSMSGGLEAWSLEIDSSVARY